MIADTLRIYRKLVNTRESNQPWMKLREEYTWLQQQQQEATQFPTAQNSNNTKPPQLLKR